MGHGLAGSRIINLDPELLGFVLDLLKTSYYCPLYLLVDLSVNYFSRLKKANVFIYFVTLWILEESLCSITDGNDVSNQRK